MEGDTDLGILVCCAELDAVAQVRLRCDEWCWEVRIEPRGGVAVCLEGNERVSALALIQGFVAALSGQLPVLAPMG